MSPPVDLVQPDTRIPDRAGIVVIGGGIIGACTALFLAKRGHSVVLCEKGRLAADLVAGDTPVVDPTPFRFSRYSERRQRPA